jgi:hypothetical protein
LNIIMVASRYLNMGECLPTCSNVNFYVANLPAKTGIIFTGPAEL